jgi:hypothetical protein
LRRPKSFVERRTELAESMIIISNALRDAEATGSTAPLRTVAVQLRALLLDEHPLLLELASQQGFALTVYATSQAYTDKVLAMKPAFYSTGDALSTQKDEMFSKEIELREAPGLLHVKIGDQSLSLGDVVKLVADTEASHYDPKRPVQLDSLGMVGLGGFPAQFRTVYALGRVVRDLAARFISATT